MSKVVWVVSLCNESETIGVFDDKDKMADAIIKDLTSCDYWDIVKDWYCDENCIDENYDKDDDFNYDAFNKKVTDWTKMNIKRDPYNFLDGWYNIEAFYLNNETT